MWFWTSLPGRTSIAKHGVATRRRGRLPFLLHYIPVFGQLAIRHTKDIDRDHWLRSPPYVAAVHHRQISLRQDHAGLIGKVLAQVRYEAGNSRPSVRNRGVVLNIIFGEIALDHVRIPLNESAGQCAKRDLFGVFHMCLLRSSLLQADSIEAA